MGINNLVYKYLPTTAHEWEALVVPALDAYWQARRENRTESDAFLCGLNEAWKRIPE